MLLQTAASSAVIYLGGAEGEAQGEKAAEDRGEETRARRGQIDFWKESRRMTTFEIWER